MILQDQLDAFAAEFMPKVPEAAKAIMKQATEDLVQSGLVDKAIKKGDTLPAFSLKNQSGETVDLKDLLAKGPLVITFFRGVWCPYCNIEIKALEAHAEKFRQAGAEVLAISPQTGPFAQKSVDTNKLSFDVLVDEGNQYAQALNLVFTMPENLREVYLGFGINVPEHNGDDTWTLPMPARLVINQAGEVVSADVNPDYTQRPDPSETLKALL